jgi:hypothetical protein
LECGKALPLFFVFSFFFFVFSFFFLFPFFGASITYTQNITYVMRFNHCRSKECVVWRRCHPDGCWAPGLVHVQPAIWLARLAGDGKRGDLFRVGVGRSMGAAGICASRRGSLWRVSWLPGVLERRVVIARLDHKSADRHLIVGSIALCDSGFNEAPTKFASHGRAAGGLRAAAEQIATVDGGPFIGFPRYSAQQAAAAEL